VAAALKRCLTRGRGQRQGPWGLGLGLGQSAHPWRSYGRLKGSAGSGHLSPVSENARRAGRPTACRGRAQKQRPLQQRALGAHQGRPGGQDADGAPGVSGRGSGDAGGAPDTQRALPAGRGSGPSPATEGPALGEGRKGVGEGGGERRGRVGRRDGEREGARTETVAETCQARTSVLGTALALTPAPAAPSPG